MFWIETKLAFVHEDTAINIEITQIITYASNQTVIKNKSEIVSLSSFQTNGIPRDHSEQLTVLLLVPPGPPTDMNSSTICKVRYDIEVYTEYQC